MREAAWKHLLNPCLHLASQVFYFLTQTTVGKILLKYGVALAVLAWVIYENWAGFVEVSHRTLRTDPLLLATGIYIVGLLITFMRWHFLVRAVGLPFTRYNAIRLGLVGFYFNTFLPGSIGGDVVKAYAIARDSTRRALAVATVLIDRIIGLWALIWFVALVGGTFWFLDNPILDNGTLKAIVVCTIVFVAVSTIIWFAAGFLSDDHAARIANRLEGRSHLRQSMAGLWRACWMYRKRPRVVLIAMLLSFVGHVGWVLVFHFSVMAFEAPGGPAQVGNLSQHAIAVPVGMTVSAFIPLPGGIGVGEKAYGELYLLLGKKKIDGIVGCMSQRVITFSLALIGYIVYLRMRVREPILVKKDEEPTSDPAEPEPVVLADGSPLNVNGVYGAK